MGRNEKTSRAFFYQVRSDDDHGSGGVQLSSTMKKNVEAQVYKVVDIEGHYKPLVVVTSASTMTTNIVIRMILIFEMFDVSPVLRCILITTLL